MARNAEGLTLRACLSCGGALEGAYCARCGQADVDPAAPTWHVVRDAVSEAVDVDGRALRTARAITSPGYLTMEFLRGRRMPYVGPLKLFVVSGALLSTTWLLTRDVDARFYGYAVASSPGAYIDSVVRGLLLSSVTIAFVGWLLSRGRRRFLDEAVFALHVIAALSAWTVVVIWFGTAWKLAWGTVTGVPASVPSLIFLLFLPAAVAALVYVVVATRRAFQVAWWVAVLRTLIVAAVAVAVVMAMIVRSKVGLLSDRGTPGGSPASYSSPKSLA